MAMRIGFDFFCLFFSPFGPCCLFFSIPLQIFFPYREACGALHGLDGGEFYGRMDGGARFAGLAFYLSRILKAE